MKLILNKPRNANDLWNSDALGQITFELDFTPHGGPKVNYDSAVHGDKREVECEAFKVPRGVYVNGKLWALDRTPIRGGFFTLSGSCDTEIDGGTLTVTIIGRGPLVCFWLDLQPEQDSS